MMENLFNSNPTFEYQYTYFAYANAKDPTRNIYFGSFKTFEEAYLYLFSLHKENLISFINTGISHCNIYGYDYEDFKLKEENFNEVDSQ